MNLYHGIVAKLENKLGTERKQTVSDVWTVFKEVVLESPIQSHQNVTDCFFNSECNDIDDKRYLRIGLEYRLRYKIDNEKYEHSEDINCEFEISDLSIQIAKEDQYTGIEYPLEMFSFEQMFSNIEDWKAFKLYKDELLEFNINGCEI